MDDDDLPRRLAEDWRRVDLSDEDRAILAYAEKLTRRPGAMEEADVEALREAGLSDRGILDVCQVTAYFAFVNRLADGLGVEPETYWGVEGEDEF